MLSHYLTSAWRSLRRKPLYTFINLSGLVLGLACSLWVLLYADYELSYDRFHQHADQLYRLERHYRASWYSTISFEGYFQAEPWQQQRMVGYLEGFPEVERAMHFMRFQDGWVSPQAGQRFEADDILMTNFGPGMLEMFTFEWVHGQPDQALRSPQSVILAEPQARQYFGERNPVGATFLLDSTLLRVDGVVKAFPANSHVHFSMIIQQPIPYWGAYTYLQLKPGSDPEALAAKLACPNPEVAESGLLKGRRLVPLTDLHFHESTNYDIEPGGDKRYLYSFVFIGLLILVLTCTNYMNLSLAMYSHRNREIGIRKVAGAQKSQIARQFLLEAVMLSLLSLPLALVVVEQLLPVLNQLLATDMQLQRLWQPLPLLGLLGLVAGTGLVAGSYPAWRLSRRDAVQLFKPLAQSGGKSDLRMRWLLVGLQFTLLIGLVSGSWLVNQQVTFMQTQDRGFQQEGVYVVKAIDDSAKYQQFKHRLLQHPHIKHVGSGAPPGSASNKLTYRGENDPTVFDDAINRWVDFDYFRVLDLPVHTRAGNLAASEGQDTLYLVNEALAHRLGYAQPIGRRVQMEPEYPGRRFAIDGVLPDFHYYSLHEAIKPQVFLATARPDYPQKALIRLHKENLPATLDLIAGTYRELFPEKVFNASFLREDLLEAYRNERRIAQISLGLTVVAVVLGIVGLLGLATYLTYRRRKELSIRRVLGASQGQLLRLLNHEFVKLTGLALLIGGPLSGWVLHAWLASFAYQIQLRWWVFGASALLVLALCVGIVSVQVLRVLQARAVEGLREE